MNNLPDFSFSPKELSVLHDKNFFETKHSITNKWEQFLSHLATHIQNWVSTNNNALPDEVKQTTPKISKGENYQGMPYMVLDYPRLFGKEDTFAFRNILLWNRGLYSTWVFEGKYMNYAIQNYLKQSSENLFLHQNTDKWIHEITQQDICLSAYSAKELIALLQKTQHTLGYLKFSCFLSFQEWNKHTINGLTPAVWNSYTAFTCFVH